MANFLWGRSTEVNRTLDNWQSFQVEAGNTKRCSHNILFGRVCGRRCVRSLLDKRVCDQFSEILWTPPVCHQFVSPLNGDGSEPALVTAGTWRTKRLEGGYDWQNMELSRHESQSFENANVCSAQVLAGSHFRQKRPQRRHTAKCSCLAKDHILLRDDFNWQGGRMECWRVGGVEIRRVYVDLHWSRTVRWAWAPQDLREMFRIIMECVSWVCEDFLSEHVWVTEPNVLWKENDTLEALNYDIDVPCPLGDAPDKDWNHEEDLKGWDWENIRSSVSMAMHFWTSKEKTEGLWDKCFENVFWCHTWLKLKTDTLRLPDYTLCFDCSLSWYISNPFFNWNFEHTGEVVWLQTRRRRQVRWLKKVCFENLFLKM